MTQCETVSATLAAAAAGRFDALSPQQVAALEAHLDDCPRCLAVLTDAVPKPDAEIAAALRRMPGAAGPGAATWDAVWQEIDATVGGAAQSPLHIARDGREDAEPGRDAILPTPASGVARRVARTGLIRKIWRPLAIAAACALMAGVWRYATLSTPPEHPIRLATNVEIDNLEVFGDSSAIVYTLNDTSGAAVIWIVDKSGA